MSEASRGPVENRGDPSTDEELYAWTMRKEAVALCLIEDIFHLRPNLTKGESSCLSLAIFCNASLQTSILAGWAAYHAGLSGLPG